jgi:hypothetical protein
MHAVVYPDAVAWCSLACTPLLLVSVLSAEWPQCSVAAELCGSLLPQSPAVLSCAKLISTLLQGMADAFSLFPPKARGFAVYP